MIQALIRMRFAKEKGRQKQSLDGRPDGLKRRII
jgi:hypothetical protein